jgi:drug/metabolite transporter (DMT)-like permease
MNLSKRSLAILALISCNLIWGAAIPIFKWSLQDIPVFSFAFLRFFLAALIILPFIWATITIKKRHLHQILLLSLIGITIPIALLFFGLELTSSITVPVIGAATPIFLIIGSFFYLQEKPHKKILFGTFISLIGICFILVNSHSSTNQTASMIGMLLIILSTITTVVYTLLIKKFHLPYPPLVLVFWTFLFGSLMFLPAFIVESLKNHYLHEFNLRAIIGVAYATIFSSAFAYSCYSFGIRYITANELGIFTYLDPITTIAIATPLLGETITINYVLGTFFIIAGIMITEGKLSMPSMQQLHIEAHHSCKDKQSEV